MPQRRDGPAAATHLSRRPAVTPNTAIGGVCSAACECAGLCAHTHVCARTHTHIPLPRLCAHTRAHTQTHAHRHTHTHSHTMRKTAQHGHAPARPHAASDATRMAQHTVRPNTARRTRPPCGDRRPGTSAARHPSPADHRNSCMRAHRASVYMCARQWRSRVCSAQPTPTPAARAPRLVGRLGVRCSALLRACVWAGKRCTPPP